MTEPRPSDKPVRNIVDSTVAITFARLFMPVAFAVIGYLMVDKMNTIDNRFTQVAASVRVTSASVNQQATDIAVIKSRVDNLTDAVHELTRSNNMRDH